MATAPTCSVCNEGMLIKRRIYRLSAPVVIIGWIFLIPSLIGMLVGGIMLMATGMAATDMDDIEVRVVRKSLVEHKIPNEIVVKVVEGKPVSNNEMASLTVEQRMAVRATIETRKFVGVGTGAGVALSGLASLLLIAGSFSFGVLGWLLTMKKRVLQCKNCQATVAAG